METLEQEYRAEDGSQTLPHLAEPHLRLTVYTALTVFLRPLFAEPFLYTIRISHRAVGERGMKIG